VSIGTSNLPTYLPIVGSDTVRGTPFAGTVQHCQLNPALSIKFWYSTLKLALVS